MPLQLKITAAVALLVTLVGGTVAVESRYAKAQDVQQQLNSLYAKQPKLRIM
jgi:Mn2+/Fe2+ NRAMP family transporter